jgi:uncharacterized membrane protein
VDRLRVGARHPLGDRRRVSLSWPRYSVAGVVGALVFGCASFTPSLVPRPWYVQGAVAGISAAFGYAILVFLAWLVHTTTGWRPSPALTRRLWIALACVGVPLLAVTLWQGQRWQREIHLLTDVPPPVSYAWLPILLLATALLVALVGIARVIRWLVRLADRHLVRRVPNRIAEPLAVLLVAVFLVTLSNGLIWRGLVNVANSASGSLNNTTNLGTYRPMDPERSGSPVSLISWASLGRQGRDFVGLGPDRTELTAFSGVAAEEPVRVYAGLSSAPSVRARAALAVRDLRRAGGFERDALVVATTTGTGLVDPAAVEALEYMYNGDTATVALQYSFLPSFISLFVDNDSAQVAGRELFNQVYDAWAALPEGDRPRLLVTGTSIGVFATESAFSGLADVRNRTDGVVWAGSPNFSPLHHGFVQQRDAGTPEWLPTYDSGEKVRFASAPKDLRPDGTPWREPRVVYLQNGSDPVLFWTPLLAFSKPDWLSERRAPDVSDDMNWFPVVTFWQVTADLPSTYYVPPGHGHRYGMLYADAWAAVAPPPGWTPRDTWRLRAQIRENEQEREAAAALARANTG